MEYDHNEDPPIEEPMYLEPAGFWLRVWATFIDIGIFAVPKAILDAAVSIYFIEVIQRSLTIGQSKDPSNLTGMILPVVIFSTILIFGTYLLIGLLYNPVLESSRLRGTPGKYFLGLVVVDLNHQRISFLRALGRHFARSIYFVPMIMAFAVIVIPPLFGEKPGAGAALAAIIGGLASTILGLIHYPMAAFTAKKQALHDKVASTYVVRSVEFSLGQYFIRAFISIVVVIALPFSAKILSETVIPGKTSESAESFSSQIMPLFEKLKNKGTGSIANSDTQTPPKGWREIKPIWRDPPAADRTKAAASPKQMNSATRLNLALVTVKANGSHSVTFDASKAIIVGFEPLTPVDELTAKCSNGCLSVTSGDQSAQGATARIIAQPVKGEVVVRLKNLEAFPIEVVLYREKPVP